MITCIKRAALKMDINAGRISSSLKSKHHILFYTLLLNVIRVYCFLYHNIVPRDTRLGRLYKKSAECITERKSLTWWETTYTWFPSFREEGKLLSSLPFLEHLCLTIAQESVQRTLHEIWFPLLPNIFNLPPHFRNFSTTQSILILSLSNIFTVFNTHTHIHTANQNIDGFVKGHHVVTLIVLTFS